MPNKIRFNHDLIFFEKKNQAAFYDDIDLIKWVCVSVGASAFRSSFIGMSKAQPRKLDT
jgi:hypothetical protein